MRHSLHFPQRNNRYSVARGNSRANLSHLPGTGTVGDNPSPETQWSRSIPYRTTCISRSDDPQKIPASDGTLGIIQAEKTSRPPSVINDSQAQTSHQGYLRSGLDRPHPLRQAGDGSDRLQPPKVGKTFLSSPPLFQRNYQRLLARRASPWRYPYRYWNRGTPKGILCQITSLCKGRNYSSRQGFLRSRDHQISGIQQSPFCHCCQAYRSGQEKNLNLILSGPFFWSGDRRVYVSTHKVEERISLRGGKASHPRRPYGTTLFNGQVQLPGYCNQHETDRSQYLKVLQWSSRCRTDYQRTQRRLSFRENPHKISRSERGLLPHTLIFLQSRKLVQTVVLTNGVSDYDA